MTVPKSLQPLVNAIDEALAGYFERKDTSNYSGWRKPGGNYQLVVEYSRGVNPKTVRVYINTDLAKAWDRRLKVYEPYPKFRTLSRFTTINMLEATAVVAVVVAVREILMPTTYSPTIESPVIKDNKDQRPNELYLINDKANAQELAITETFVDALLKVGSNISVDATATYKVNKFTQERYYEANYVASSIPALVVKPDLQHNNVSIEISYDEFEQLLELLEKSKKMIKPIKAG